MHMHVNVRKMCVCVCVRACACMRVCSSSLSAGIAFVAVSYQSPSKPSNVYAPLDSPPSPHPLGSLELAVGPYPHHGHQWLRRTVRSIYLARPRCPAATHPRAVWRGSGQPTYLTVCRPQKQGPDSSLGPALCPFMGKETRRRRRSVYASFCVHTYDYLFTAHFTISSYSLQHSVVFIVWL